MMFKVNIMHNSAYINYNRFQSNNRDGQKGFKALDQKVSQKFSAA